MSKASSLDEQDKEDIDKKDDDNDEDFSDKKQDNSIELVDNIEDIDSDK